MKNSVHHERSKHFDIRLHFIREVITRGTIKAEKVATEDNAADMLTKVLPLSKFKHCQSLVNVMDQKH